ncbi:MAG: exosortase [Prosthecobacter sp.]|nr:exosortase [Prosthecobacter sp.]
MSATSTAPPSTSASMVPARWAVLGVVLAMLTALVGIFPYQHWDFTERSSILGGILRKAQQDSEWWFCLLTPFLVAWLIARMRRDLATLPLQGTWLGLPVLALGMLFYGFGFKADTAYPGYLAIQIITLGLILQLGGLPWLRRLFFPWAFLAFTWPMLPLESMLALPLRMWTARLSALVLGLIGVPVVQEGTGLHSAADELGGLAHGQLFQLDVEEPCSGIRSLFSLLMLSALYGWLSLKTWPARAVLFASAIPLAMLGNIVRMVLLALGSLWLGSDFAIGRNIDGHQEMSFFHSLAGFAVFGVALAGMFGISSWMERTLDAKPMHSHAKEQLDPATPGRRIWAHLAATVVILGGGLLHCATMDTAYHVSPASVRLAMPVLLDGYVSTDQPMTEREQLTLAEDVSISRRFYTKPERAILASIVVSGAEKRSLHSPDVCLPAQGWQVSSTREITLDLGDGFQPTVTLMTMFRDVEDATGRRGRLRALNLFWYMGSDGSTCAGYQEHVWRTYRDAFFRNLNHRWTLLTFFAPLKAEPAGLADPLAEITALQDVESFIRSLMPHLLVAQKSP